MGCDQRQALNLDQSLSVRMDALLNSCRNVLFILSAQPNRLTIALALSLILALSLGMVRSAQASVFYNPDLSQELRLADDDSRDVDGEQFILPATLLLPFLPPASPPRETAVFFFSSLRLPPATPPPIRA